MSSFSFRSPSRRRGLTSRGGARRNGVTVMFAKARGPTRAADHSPPEAPGSGAGGESIDRQAGVTDV